MVDIGKDTLTPPGPEISEFAKGLLQRGIFMIKSVAEQVDIAQILPEDGKLYGRNNLNTVFSSRRKSFRNTISIIVISQRNRL